MAWIIIGIVLLVVYFLSIYNTFVRMKNNANEGFSTMDVYMKKRYDLIPNLVETVKGYATHEKETLQKVVEARNIAVASNSEKEKIANDNALTGTLKTLFAVAESYPDLKANSNFQELMNSLNVVENDIASSRKYYNGVVNQYNIKIESFPSNVVASMFKFEKKPLYEVKNEEERENVKVKF